MLNPRQMAWLFRTLLSQIYFRASEILQPNLSLEFRPPDRISLSGNMADNLRMWKQGFTLFMTATESEGKSGQIKITMQLSTIGPEALVVQNLADACEF